MLFPNRGENRINLTYETLTGGTPLNPWVLGKCDTERVGNPEGTSRGHLDTSVDRPFVSFSLVSSNVPRKTPGPKLHHLEGMSILIRASEWISGPPICILNPSPLTWYGLRQYHSITCYLLV